MLTLAATFGKQYWKEILLAIIVVSGVLYVRHLYTTVADQKVTIKQMEAAEVIYKENDKKMTAALAAIDKSFGIIEEVDRQNKENFTKLQQLVNTNNGKLASQLKTILGEKKPQTCEETIEYLISAKGAYQ